MPQQADRTARIEARIAPDALRIVRRAAEIQGRSVSDFVSLAGALLWDAIECASRSEIAACALAVDAKDEQAATFYRHHGFVAFASLPDRLIMPFPKRSL